MHVLAGFSRRFGWALPPLLIFATTRLIDAAFLVVGARNQAALNSSFPSYHVLYPTPASPGYWGVVANWDGQWYRSIAESGYPSPLPTENGEVVPNEWAFYPGYPILVRLLMFATRWEFGVAATFVSVTCAGAAVILLYRMILDSGDRFLALGSALALCTFPAAPVLQVAYSEGLALLLVATSLFCLRERRYGWLTAAAVALALTRPVVLPLALVIGISWLARWRQHRVDAFPKRERIALAGGALVAVASVALWPLIAALSTGDARAFAKTQAAWPLNKQAAQGLWSNWIVKGVTEDLRFALIAAIALAIVAFSVTRPAARRWGLQLRAWSIAYPFYLVLATRPSPSALRYFLLAIGPLWPMPEVRTQDESSAQRRMRWIFLLGIGLVGVIGQYLWVTNVFTIDVSPDVQPYP